jgi:hypothetical protein
MTALRQLVLEQAIRTILAEAKALAEEMRVSPREALYALMPPES